MKSLWDNDFTEIDPLDLAVEGELEDNGYQTAVLRMLQNVFEDWKSKKEGKDGEGADEWCSVLSLAKKN